MPDRANITIPSFPQCPDCSAEAHVLTFHPIVDAEDTRVLSEFAWRCPNGHKFATAMFDIPLTSWRYCHRGRRDRSKLRRRLGA